MGRVSDAISTVQAKSASMTGNELKKLLVSLKFEVKKCAKGGHHLVTHDDLEDFVAVSYDAGHGKRKQMRSCYPLNIARVLKDHQSELEIIVGDKDAEA